jgi:hypothetical protein
MTGNMLPRLLPSIVLAVVTTVSLHAQDPPVPPPHVRIADDELRRLFDAGVAASPTLGALVRRLDHSDVVAYIRFEPPRGAVHGSLQFVGAAAGVRYVLIRVARQPTQSRQLALIAHELQHAVEVAAAPHVVDLQTFVQEYERIGDASHQRLRRERSFETLAARVTGRRVLEELNGRDLRQPRRRRPEVATLTATAPEVPSEE